MSNEKLEAVKQHCLDEKKVAENQVEPLTFSDRWWYEGQIEAYDDVLAFIRALEELDE